MMRLRTVLMVLMLLIMAACSGQDEAVPTLMEMPDSDSGTTSVAANPTSEGNSPALPASWTPTSTETPTITPSATLTPSVTPSSTITNTPSPTYTSSAVPPTQERPVTNLLELALMATPLPREFVQQPSEQVLFPTPDQSGLIVTPGVTSVANCTYFPSGGFAAIFNTNADIAQRIGCPEGFPPTTLSLEAASQTFERGIMIWIGDSPAQIYVLYNDGRYQNFADTYNALDDPISSGATPPEGLAEPIRGFGKIWRTYINVRSDLGWATSTEQGATATVQKFDSGMMLSLTSRTDILVFLNNASSITGSWQAIPGQF